MQGKAHSIATALVPVEVTLPVILADPEPADPKHNPHAQQSRESEKASHKESTLAHAGTVPKRPSQGNLARRVEGKVLRLTRPRKEARRDADLL